MPGKNETKIYLENGFYHLYNRGVEKRLIFLDEMDYSTFLSYLKCYLEPKKEDDLRKKLSDPSTGYKEKDKIIKLLNLRNYSKSIKLMAYCLMPNHFHLLLKQTNANAITKFMNSLITRYSMYFNKKYKRVGPLCQGIYKGVLVETNDQLLYLSYYIHHQALYFQEKQILKPQPSSYPNYLGQISQNWVKPEDILSFFGDIKHTNDNKSQSYKSFIERSEEETFEPIAKLLLD